MSITTRQSEKRQTGFSLLEIAVGMLILGIVLLSFSGIFTLVFETSNQTEEKQNMKRIHDAINTYLAVNAYLPCPDVDLDGVEDRLPDPHVSGAISYCESVEGGIPYTDLGVESEDAWGNAYYYRVNERAASNLYVNQVCESASVLGKLGARGNTDLWMCPATNIYYCGAQASCTAVCHDPSTTTPILPTVTCVNSVDPRPTDALTSAPFFHLATPPYGTLTGVGNLNIADENAVQQGEGVVAVVVSWGANGDSVNRASCAGGTTDELENCDNDASFVDTQTGENRDFVRWVTVNQAKVAIISSGEFR